MFRRVGIEKGRPFKPDVRQRKLLEEAAFVGEAMAKANDLAERYTPPYWPGASWKVALGLDPSQRAKFYDELDQRSAWFYEALSTSQGMVITTPGVGSVYLAAYADKDGDWLEGGKQHTLRVPPSPPAEQFWSIAVYSVGHAYADRQRPEARGGKLTSGRPGRQLRRLCGPLLRSDCASG
jgi:hypothetical protein